MHTHLRFTYNIPYNLVFSLTPGLTKAFEAEEKRREKDAAIRSKLVADREKARTDLHKVSACIGCGLGLVS